MGKVCPELVGLAGPFTRIARAMSSEWNVRIVPSGAKCDTDGETIRIPFTADYLPREMRQVLHGMLDHEVCHVAEERRHKKALRPSPVAILRAETDARLQLLLNVVEDVRIEHRYSKQYVGVAQNLAALNLQAANDLAIKMDDAGIASVGWWKCFSSAMILLAHGLDASWADADFGDYLKACEPELVRMRAGVGPWCDDSLDLAKRILAKVKDRHEDVKRPKSKKRVKTDDDGDGHGGHGDPDDDDEPEGDGRKLDPKEGSPDDDVDDADLHSDTRNKIEKYVIHDATANQRYIPHPKAHALDAVVEVAGCRATYARARAEVLPQIRVLRQKQRALVSAFARRRVRSGLDRGDVDDNVLADVRVGATDLFSELTRKRYLNTAITGLVDFSGSMQTNASPEHGAYYALRTSIALAESWSALGVANEWLGFTAQDMLPTGITIEDLEGPYFCRPPLQHLVIKAFGESFHSARAKFGGIRGIGSNIDGEAILWAWQRLVVRREARKMLVVICDGEPATWNSCLDKKEIADEVALQTHLRHAIRTVTKSGVECICIGAGTDGPREFFNKDTGAKFVYVSSMATMAVDVFRVMKQRLTDLA